MAKRTVSSKWADGRDIRIRRWPGELRGESVIHALDVNAELRLQGRRHIHRDLDDSQPRTRGARPGPQAPEPVPYLCSCRTPDRVCEVCARCCTSGAGQLRGPAHGVAAAKDRSGDRVAQPCKKGRNRTPHQCRPVRREPRRATTHRPTRSGAARVRRDHAVSGPTVHCKQ
jgi:hypothetical protein